MRVRAAWPVLGLALSLASGAAGQEPRSGQGWEVAAPAAAGFDAALLAEGVERVGQAPGVRCLLVARGGRLVVERAWAGARCDRPHDVKSASKSLLSALVGIAREQGLLDLDTPVAAALANELPPEPGARERITVRHLLTMTSGLESTSGAAYGRWVASGNWARYALARPLLHPPGREFAYSTGNSHLLSVLLARASGQSLLAFARRHLLDALGIRVASWQRDPQGFYFGGNSLALTPRALARFGQLYLERGHAAGRQLVPAAWIEESTRVHASGWPDRYGGYGYLWWVPGGHPPGTFLAVGYGGQFLYVVPERDLLVVLTASPAGKGAAWDRRLLGIFRDYLVRAARPSISSWMKRSNSWQLASEGARNSSPRRTWPVPGE